MNWETRPSRWPPARRRQPSPSIGARFSRMLIRPGTLRSPVSGDAGSTAVAGITGAHPTRSNIWGDAWPANTSGCTARGTIPRPPSGRGRRDWGNDAPARAIPPPPTRQHNDEERHHNSLSGCAHRDRCSVTGPQVGEQVQAGITHPPNATAANYESTAPEPPATALRAGCRHRGNLRSIVAHHLSGEI
jgi:hypothetical protein